MKRDFLVELGTEELPPKSLKDLMNAFAAGIDRGLGAASLARESVEGFASPRRLAVRVNGLVDQQPAITSERLGPTVASAFDAAGHPTPAAEGFARGCGITVSQLQQVSGERGLRLAYRTVQPGQPTTTLLPSIVEVALRALPIARRMRWGSRREEFVRPVHWLVMLFGEEVVEAQMLGLTADRYSRGHRFHHPEPLPIATPRVYIESLRKARVMADFSERRESIRAQAKMAAVAAGGVAIIDEVLLDEVAALTEWPVTLVGRFETRFLEVPPEALMSAMTEHQKYFPMVDDNGNLLSLFVATANIMSSDPAQVIAGNERVIRPRLADATFFYQTDRKTTLAAQREKLKSVVFQENLGSVFDKTERVAALAERLAPRLGADPALARRAAELSKSDLVSAMVLEFADLQGVMGRYYAIEDGEHTEVCEALCHQYWPRFAGDRIPETATGATLALADRLDTLVGIFGIGQAPSGNRDPFALRRASLGVLRILVERKIDLDLRECLAAAADLHNNAEIGRDTQEQVLTYLMDRFKSWYDDRGIATEVFLAVAAKGLTNPFDIDRRVHAVAAFSERPESDALAAANKRVANILSKQRVEAANTDLALFREPAELALASAVTRLHGQVRPLLHRGDYSAVLRALAELREPVDDFFEQVMVMADDVALRTNRVGLLMQLRALFLEVADIALLATAKAAG